VQTTPRIIDVKDKSVHTTPQNISKSRVMHNFVPQKPSDEDDDVTWTVESLAPLAVAEKPVRAVVTQHVPEYKLDKAQVNTPPEVTFQFPESNVVLAKFSIPDGNLSKVIKKAPSDPSTDFNVDGMNVIRSNKHLHELISRVELDDSFPVRVSAADIDAALADNRFLEENRPIIVTDAVNLRHFRSFIKEDALALDGVQSLISVLSKESRSKRLNVRYYDE